MDERKLVLFQFISHVDIRRMSANQMRLGGLTALMFTCLSVFGQVALPGNVDVSFNPGNGIDGVFGAAVLAVQSTGKVIVGAGVGGQFTSINGVGVTNLARLNADGTVDANFRPSLSWGSGYGKVYDVRVVPDDRILVAGLFDALNGQPFYNLVRLFSDGKLDPTFIGAGLEMAFVDVRHVVPANTGEILVNNVAAMPGGTQAAFLFLLPSGLRDTTFTPTTQVGLGYDLVQQADGKVLVVGYTSATFYSLFRFNANGSLDTSFHSPAIDNASGPDMCLALQPDGKILLGGAFTKVDSFTRGGIVRLSTDGFVDTSFIPGKGGIGVSGWNTNLPPLMNDFKRVAAIVLQQDGKILLVGQFATFDSMIVKCITRLNAEGSLDTGFNSGTGAMSGDQLGFLTSVAIAPDGKIVIGGMFDQVNDIPRRGVARLYGGDMAREAPTIITNPTSQIVNAGSNVTFSVTATGTAPLRYQWLFNNSLMGATNASLLLPNVQPTNEGSYAVVVTNWAGSATSSVATLTVNTPLGLPVIVVQPEDQTASVGGTATFSVAAIGPPPLVYQWEFNSTDIPNETNSSLTLSNVQMTESGNYVAIVSNPAGSLRTRAAALVVTAPHLSSRVVAWGWNGYSQTNVPEGLSSVVAIAAGYYACLAVQADGALVRWGGSLDGVLPSGFTDIEAIAQGDFHGLALRRNGSVLAWGMNASGRTNVPADLSNVVAVAAGGAFSLALRVDGKVVAWGHNGWGQTNVPTDLTNVVAIAAGAQHCLALNAGGAVKAWGDNTYGQTDVPSWLTNAVAIAGGGYHSIALLANGKVASWGFNNYGQTNVPIDLTNATAVSAGFYHILALLNDGTVIGWGKNDFGQATPPATLTNRVAMIAAGGACSLALTAVVPPSLSAPRRQDNGTFAFSIFGEVAQIFRIEGSTNLEYWSELASMTNVLGITKFYDHDATNFSRRFYRVKTP